MEKYKILIIEDDPIIQTELQVLLNGNGYEASAVTDFTSVMQAVKNTHPYLILLDIKLPQESGYSICSQIRIFSNVPIIFEYLVPPRQFQPEVIQSQFLRGLCSALWQMEVLRRFAQRMEDIVLKAKAIPEIGFLSLINHFQSRMYFFVGFLCNENLLCVLYSGICYKFMLSLILALFDLCCPGYS